MRKAHVSLPGLRAGLLQGAAANHRARNNRQKEYGVMKRTKTDRSTSRSKSARYADLKKILEDRRREIMSEVQGKIRDVRTEGNTQKLNEVFDAGESSE